MNRSAKTLTPDLLHQMDAYWRAAHYLSVRQILEMEGVIPAVIGQQS